MKTPSIRPPAALIAAAAAILALVVSAGVASAATGGPASPPHPAPYPGAGTICRLPRCLPSRAAGWSPRRAARHTLWR